MSEGAKGMTLVHELKKSVHMYIYHRQGEAEMFEALDNVLKYMLQSKEAYGKIFEEVVSIFEPSVEVSREV